MNADSINPVSPNEPISFERVREEPNALWQKIHESEGFNTLLQVGVGIGTAIIFVAVILPVSLLLTAITAVGFIALGLCTPALLHPQAAKIWRMVKNKLVGLTTDLIYLPKTVLMTPLAFEPNASRNQSENKNPLIVFSHGFLHNKTCFNSLGKELQEATKNAENPITARDIYAINSGAPVTIEEIDFFSRFMATKLEQIRKERNLEKLDVIFDCHSMGGLVAAHFTANYASIVGVNVLRLITNGTPWHGTPMAYMASWAACGIEMWPKHSFQTILAEKIDKFKDRIYTIASKGDTIVPYRSALGSELNISPEHQMTLEVPCGHLAMLHDKQGRQENIRLITQKWNEQET